MNTRRLAHPRRRLAATLLAVGVSYCVTSHAVADEETDVGEQLRELKGWCDEGLVSADVCEQKQREILGLEPETALRTTPLPAGSTLEPGLDASTVDYRHPLGVDLKLPAGWLAHDPDVPAESMARLEERLSGHHLSRNLLAHMALRIESESSEVLRKGNSFLSIRRNRVPLPTSELVARKLCERMSERLSSPAAARTVHECKLTSVGGRPALYADSDSMREGLRTVQYWIERVQGETYVFLLESENAVVEERKEELKEMLASLRWQ